MKLVSGADPGCHVRGAIYKHKVFSCEGRRREAMLVGPGDLLLQIFFEKNDAIRCNLVHSRAHISRYYIAGYEVIFNVAFADKPEIKKKEKSLKCDLMVFEAVLTSAGTILIPFWLQRTKIPAGLKLTASG